MALIVFMLIGIALLGACLPLIDQNPKVDGGEWRVRPSQSGKSWEVYRYTGYAQTERFTRFKSPQSAADFIRRRLAQAETLNEHTYDLRPDFGEMLDEIQESLERRGCKVTVSRARTGGVWRLMVTYPSEMPAEDAAAQHRALRLMC